MNDEEVTPFSFDLLTDVHWMAQDVNQYLVFSSEVEVSLTRSLERMAAAIDKRMEGMSKGDRQEFFESHAHDLHQYGALFPGMHRESMLITLYNYLEHNLNVVSVGVEKEIGTNIQLKHLRDRGIVRALLFLDRVAGFDLSAIDADLSFIRNTNKLRNIVVHNGGVLPTSANHAVNLFVNAQDSLAGRPDHPVTIGKEFPALFAEKIRSLFKEIGNAMQRYMGNPD